MTTRKSLWRLPVLMLALALSVAFASCNSDDDDTVDVAALVGTWTGATVNYQYTLTFTPDGAYNQEGFFIVKSTVKKDFREKGLFKVEGNTMTMTATSFEVYDTETDSWIDEELPEDEVVLTYRFSVKGKKLSFFALEDSKMKEPVMVFVKQ
jgi:hypothetical protein